MTDEFQLTDVEALLTLMEQWGIAEMHLTVEDSALDLVRAITHVAPREPVKALDAPTPVPAPTMFEAAMPEPVAIFAPAVGVFHLASSGFPKRAPRVGDRVQAGQTIGSIELMHIPTDLVAPISGIIASIQVEDGDGVEYGQPLMIIQPTEEVEKDEARAILSSA